MIHAGLTERVIPIRLPSVEAASRLRSEPTLTVDLVYLDGGHDEASVEADLAAWYPFVRGHGVLCGDDWGFPDVRRVVSAFAREHGLSIYLNDPFWRLDEGVDS